MTGRIRGIRDVAEKHLCLGCGTCAFAQPDAIEMVDDIERGRRPRLLPLASGKDPDTSVALAVCPGVALDHQESEPRPEHIAELWTGWGPVLEVWEGYAADDELRYAASSGGIATALALHCMEHEDMHGTLHIRARDDRPYLNETVMSHTREEMLAATGSRYAPASPCDRLDLIEQAPAQCVFIGKPCDVGGLAKVRRTRPALDERVGLTIGIFCAGTPSTRGTLEMLRAMGVTDPASISSVRYRGNGWPGMAEVTVPTTSGVESHQMTYDDSWGDILQKHRQWRCYVCADHTGEFADVAVGDPWYREIPAGEPGRSLVLVRTERGRRIVRAAIAAGTVTLEPAAPDLLPASQANLLRTRGATWGRILATRVVGVAAPRYRNLPLLPIWWRTLGPKEKFQSLVGTVKRVVTKRLYRRSRQAGSDAPPPGPTASP